MEICFLLTWRVIARVFKNEKKKSLSCTLQTCTFYYTKFKIFMLSGRYSYLSCLIGVHTRLEEGKQTA